MDIMLDHRRHAEECLARAQISENRTDKALWLTLAQSWVRLAQYIADVEDGAANVGTTLAFDTDAESPILAGER
jgi:hypothetical protein